MVLAGVVLVATSASWIDPVASLVVSVAVLWSTWHLVASAVGVLLDRSPAGMSAHDIARSISSHEDVDVAHHVHVRSLGSGRHSASAHVVVHGETTVHRSQQIVDELSTLVHDRFGIGHVTIQVECSHHCGDGAQEHDQAEHATSPRIGRSASVDR